MANQRYVTEKGKRIEVDSQVAAGGEGTVYRVIGHPNKVAKIYHSYKNTPEKEPKLKAMVSNPPSDPTRPNHVSIAWPTDLLYENGKFVGYMMPLISKSPEIFSLYNPKQRAQEQEFKGFNRY